MDDPEKIKGIIVRVTLIFIMMFAIFGGCSQLNKRFNLPDDNPAEQTFEAIIRDEIGIDVDLTP